jgi:hypothetical protein
VLDVNIRNTVSGVQLCTHALLQMVSMAIHHHSSCCAHMWTSHDGGGMVLQIKCKCGADDVVMGYKCILNMEG